MSYFSPQSIRKRASKLLLLGVLRLSPFLRRLALRRRDKPGVTVISVNYHSLDALEVLVEMVRRHSGDEVRILIIDNHSTRAARAWLRRQSVRNVPVPINLGHSVAMDLGWFLAETEFVIALDVDAFPITGDWIESVVEPLRSGALVAGGRVTDKKGPRAAVHPCFLAMKRSTFLDNKLSFKPRQGFDVGEAITADVGVPNAHFIDQSEVRGPGGVGSVFGGKVYHNFYGTRFRRDKRNLMDKVVRRQDADAAWNEALERWVNTSDVHETKPSGVGPEVPRS
jgi:glycosyltransferase involved in cell wall biosynthesis